MSKSTPGPWSAEDQGTMCPGEIWIMAKDPRDKDGIEFSIAAVRAGCGEAAEAGDNAANARLIAAAPTMADYIAKRAATGDAEAAAIMESIHAGR